MTNPYAPLELTEMNRESRDTNIPENYRSVSTSAIGVLIAGLLSPLAFLSPILWLIPVAVICASIWVLRTIRLNSQRLTGSTLVWIALLLACLVLGWAPAKYAARQNVLVRDARQVADAWFDLLIQRDLAQVHQWHLSSARRASPDIPLEKYYKENTEAQKDRQDFLDIPAIKRLLALKDLQVQYVAKVQQNYFSNATQLVLQYHLTGKQGDEPVAFEIYVVVVRQEMSENTFEMFIGNLVDYDPIPLDDN